MERDELKQRIEAAAEAARERSTRPGQPPRARDEKGRFTVAEEAEGLIRGGARSQHYGEPVKNHRDIGLVWAVLLDLPDPIPPRTVAVMMAALKLVREGGPKAKRDNLVDACGYLLIAEMATEEGAT